MSKCGCPFCTGYKVRDKSLGGGRWLSGEYRTFDSLAEDHNKWMQETGGKRNKLKLYHSSEFLPMKLVKDQGGLEVI